ncbi:GNAT family N-acetyltransferase [Roseitranquillus sediminis]|uniref:GNAT family N-acetyltransferase n=1 Tax=Roseitranquillus sediminis TaxID=2809051 RepID=UPI001D0C3125|nr:GNAT family N-acetyltransferase [Roseitranquillus sediminis]MBM9594226.1 GNAT family N-acetyltransferase [Roseitranquillus sediminis]
MTIRLLGAGDAAAFREIRLEALRAHPNAYASTVADWSDRPIEAFSELLAEGGTYGLWEGERLVAIGGIDWQTGGHSRHRATIVAMYVCPDARGRGAAGRLIEAMAERAQREGVLQLELVVGVGNDMAVRAYERAGFRTVARLPGWIRCGGREIDEWLMVRRLDA